MDYITAVNNYVVKMPSGELNGFIELSDARNFISEYYLDKILDYRKGGGAFLDIYQEKDQEELNRLVGVDEGECQIYDLDSLIERIQNSNYFEEEREEIISKLLKEKIELNVNEYSIDDIFADVEEKWTV